MYATLETRADQLIVTLSGEHRDGSHTVLHDVTGPAGGTTPAAAHVLYFDGPTTDAAFAAADFAYRERIAPAFRAVPGAVRSLVLFDPVRRATVVVSTAVDPAASFSTGKPRRDKDVKDRRFLDVARFPTIRFDGTALTGDDGRRRLDGTLTVRDVTGPVTLDVVTARPIDGGHIVRATGTIDRRAFGVTAGRGLIGPRLTVTIDVHAVS
jgi:polyisoprenoid-binding protein YceI